MHVLEAKVGDFLSSSVDIISPVFGVIYKTNKKYKILGVSVITQDRINLVITDSEIGVNSEMFDITNFKKCLSYKFSSIKEERMAKIKSIL